MTDDELEQAIAALHARERELLIAGDSAAAFDLMGTKFVLLSTLDNRRRRPSEEQDPPAMSRPRPRRRPGQSRTR